VVFNNIQLLPLYEVNIGSCQPVGVFPEVFSPRENNLSRVDNLIFTSYEGHNCFIIPKLLYDVYDLNVLFCRRQQNNFQYRKDNYGTGFPVVRGCRQDDRVSPVRKFSEKNELFYYFYIVKKYVEYI